jgi:hypothetical protein
MWPGAAVALLLVIAAAHYTADWYRCWKPSSEEETLLNNRSVQAA